MEIPNEGRIKDLLIHAMKELGEIAEVLVRKNRPDHWKDELGDLCAFAIRPLLELAELDFETACELGEERKFIKMQEKEKNAPRP